jgi:hypothetical protein
MADTRKGKTAVVTTESPGGPPQGTKDVIAYGNPGFIRRLNSRVNTRVEFRGGPSPRVPDSLFIPAARPTRHPLAQSTVVVNPVAGYSPAPYLRNHYLRRVVPFNIVNGTTIVNVPTGQLQQGNFNKVTMREGAPPSLSTLIKPIGN